MSRDQQARVLLTGGAARPWKTDKFRSGLATAPEGSGLNRWGPMFSQPRWPPALCAVRISAKSWANCASGRGGPPVTV
jgi:hypothetical protein